MRSPYPDIEPYQVHLFDMRANEGETVHQIYVEECGNPNGIPIVFLHGGPGSGCRPSHRCLFDPHSYRIILFDQRGCGRSQPYGCLENNRTEYLINDLEQIRETLVIKQWIVFGGSWGATLALTYAQQYSKRVTALALRGVFLGRKSDVDWVYDHGGAAKIFPEAWQNLMSTLTPCERETPLRSFYTILLDSDTQRSGEVREALNQWERHLVRLASPAHIELKATTNRRDGDAKDAAKIIQLHYSLNECFISHRPILANMKMINTIPTFVIHGRYDMVCPLEQAWQLYQKNQNIELDVMPLSGHVAEEPEILEAILNLTDRLALRFSG